MVLMPGEDIEIDVTFAPKGGDPGTRTASVKFTLDGPKEVVAELTGEAGTRTLAVNPTAISFPMTTFGKYQRRTVAITNTGTMPVELSEIVVSPDNGTFEVGKIDRMEIPAGATEYLEVTFVAPGAPGTTEATLDVRGNMTNVAQVLLSGPSAGKTKKQDDNPNSTIPSQIGVIEDGVDAADGLENLSTSGVETGSGVAGMTLRQSIPNPGRDLVEISYVLANPGQVELALYDASGRLVRVIDAGDRPAGERTVRVDVRDLAGGVYHYRLMANGATLTRSLSVVM
jgi:hypothetical protein